MKTIKKTILVSVLLLTIYSCKRKWTDKDKSEFVSGCLSRSVADMGEAKAKSYCNCLLNKVVARYPNASDAKYLKYDSAIVRLAKDCWKQP